MMRSIPLRGFDQVSKEYLISPYKANILKSVFDFFFSQRKCVSKHVLVCAFWRETIYILALLFLYSPA